jgi:hypothetical protein
LLTALININEKLTNDQEEIIQTNALKARILLMHKSIEMGVSTKQTCFNELLPFYQKFEVRTKFVLIEMTPYLVKILPQPGIQMHFLYLEHNIKLEECEISELVINNLKHIFNFVDLEDQERLLKKLLTKKPDVEL